MKRSLLNLRLTRVSLLQVHVRTGILVSLDHTGLDFVHLSESQLHFRETFGVPASLIAVKARSFVTLLHSPRVLSNTSALSTWTSMLQGFQDGTKTAQEKGSQSLQKVSKCSQGISATFCKMRDSLICLKCNGSTPTQRPTHDTLRRSPQ